MKTTNLLLLLALAWIPGVRANDTSLHDGRFGPEPLESATGKESPVRMVAEHLKVDFGYQYTSVHCAFTFRNTLDSGPVEQLVGFPDTGAAQEEVKRRDPAHADTIGEMGPTSRLRDLKTWVNGKRMKSELKYESVETGHGRRGDTTVWFWGKDTKGVRAWHTLRVVFPVGQDVIVEREYRVENGASAAGAAFFEYTTATGGVWKGTIGRLQADVTLRDGVSPGTLIWPGAKRHGETIPPEFCTSPARSEWQVVDKTHLRLVWKDFEPRTEEAHRGFRLARDFHGW
jgi:hypothetical protein